mgnify:CR=1 FL=1
MQVHVNGSCIGCGLCASTCPNECFNTNGGTAAAYSPEVGPDLADQVQAAADSCPVSAIEVR